MYLQFPARIPIEDSIEYKNIKQHFSHIQVEEIIPGIGRTAGRQAAFQIAALFVTLSIALIGGLLTGKNISEIYTTDFKYVFFSI